MKTSRRQAAINQMVYWDRQITFLMNRTLRWRTVSPFFRVISNLGNGKFWYALMVILPLLHGHYGIKAALQLLKRAGTDLTNEAIMQGTVALDEYSFPSGHTMHAVAFSVIAVSWFPALLPLLPGFTVLIAISRVVLGLHYPTDVVLGALFGMLISQLSLLIVG